MKKAILIILPIVVLIGLIYYKATLNKNPISRSNVNKIPLKFKNNKIRCEQCKMYLVGKNFAVQIITQDNKTHFFDCPGCSILWLKDNRIDTKNVVIWMYSADTKKWIDGKKTYFSINASDPMHYGFGAYEKNRKGFINFKEMRLKMIKGETMRNPETRKKILAKTKKDL